MQYTIRNAVVLAKLMGVFLGLAIRYFLIK